MYAENIKGKLFVITGAYGGIGIETTRAILAVGGRVVIGGRSPDKVEDLVSQMSSEFNTKDRVDGYALDLADLESVQTFSKWVKEKYKDERIELINNAGVVAPVAATKQGVDVLNTIMFT